MIHGLGAFAAKLQQTDGKLVQFSTLVTYTQNFDKKDEYQKVSLQKLYINQTERIGYSYNVCNQN